MVCLSAYGGIVDFFYCKRKKYKIFRQASRFVETPVIKFNASVLSYVIFLIMVVTTSAAEPSSFGEYISQHKGMGQFFIAHCNRTNKSVEEADFWVRPHVIADAGMIILGIWIVGKTNDFKNIIIAHTMLSCNVSYIILTQ